MMSSFHSNNETTIFCNNYILKYLKYVILNSKHFTTRVIQSIEGTLMKI